MEKGTAVLAALLDEEFTMSCPHCDGTGQCPEVESEEFLCGDCGASHRSSDCNRCKGEGRVTTTPRKWIGEWLPKALKRGLSVESLAEALTLKATSSDS